VLRLVLPMWRFGMSVLANVSGVEDSVGTGNNVVRGFNAIKSSENGLNRCVIGERIELGLEIWADAPEHCGKDDQSATLRNLVSSSVDGKWWMCTRGSGP